MFWNYIVGIFYILTIFLRQAHISHYLFLQNDSSSFHPLCLFVKRLVYRIRRRILLEIPLGLIPHPAAKDEPNHLLQRLMGYLTDVAEKL